MTRWRAFFLILFVLLLAVIFIYFYFPLRPNIVIVANSYYFKTNLTKDEQIRLKFKFAQDFKTVKFVDVSFNEIANKNQLAQIVEKNLSNKTSFLVLDSLLIDQLDLPQKKNFKVIGINRESSEIDYLLERKGNDKIYSSLALLIDKKMKNNPLPVAFIYQKGDITSYQNSLLFKQTSTVEALHVVEADSKSNLFEKLASYGSLLIITPYLRDLEYYSNLEVTQQMRWIVSAEQKSFINRKLVDYWLKDDLYLSLKPIIQGSKEKVFPFEYYIKKESKLF